MEEGGEGDHGGQVDAEQWSKAEDGGQLQVQMLSLFKCKFKEVGKSCGWSLYVRGVEPIVGQGGSRGGGVSDSPAQKFNS